MSLPYLELLEARLLIEPHLAGLTARKLSAAERVELGVYLDEASQYLDGSNDYALQWANMAFYCGIARVANSVLSQSLESLLELYSAEQRVILTVYDDRGRDYREHRAILAELSNSNPEQAAELMRAHLQDVKATVKQNWPGDGQ